VSATGWAPSGRPDLAADVGSADALLRDLLPRVAKHALHLPHDLHRQLLRRHYHQAGPRHSHQSPLQLYLSIFEVLSWHAGP